MTCSAFLSSANKAEFLDLGYVSRGPQPNFWELPERGRRVEPRALRCLSGKMSSARVSGAPVDGGRFGSNRQGPLGFGLTALETVTKQDRQKRGCSPTFPRLSLVFLVFIIILLKVPSIAALLQRRDLIKKERTQAKKIKGEREKLEGAEKKGKGGGKREGKK